MKQAVRKIGEMKILRPRQTQNKPTVKTIDSEQKDEPTEEPKNSNVEQSADKQRKVVIRTERQPQEDNNNE